MPKKMPKNRQIWSIQTIFGVFLSIILAVVTQFTSNLFHAHLLLLSYNCTLIRQCDLKSIMPILSKKRQIWPFLAKIGIPNLRSQDLISVQMSATLIRGQ